MTPRLFVRRPARADIADDFKWYESRSAGLGHEFLRVIRVAFASITRSPEQYPVAIDDIRRCTLRRFPFVIYYRWEPAREQITVYAIMHCSREPGYWHHREE